MHKPNHVFISVTEEYRKLREIQTFLNRFVWSTELCYSYFLEIFQNKTDLHREEISDVFTNLPIQAWFKNKSGNGKYNLTLKEHNNIVHANQVYICRSAIILYNSYFDDYLKYRVNSSFSLLKNLTNNDFKTSNIKVDIKKLLKADCCRLIRNKIVHQPENNFLSIKEIKADIKQKITNQLFEDSNKNKSFLQTEYSEKFIKENLDKAIHEVFDSAIIEVEGAANRNVILPYEFFFMLYTFTNYDAIASDIEQILFYDEVPKTFYNRVLKGNVHKDRQEMIIEPTVVGLVYNIETNNPIKFAKVQVLNNPFNSTSDQTGRYYLSPNLKNGTYIIETYAEGYELNLIELSTSIGKTLSFNIGLKPSQISYH
jgi:hypothetical protein